MTQFFSPTQDTMRALRDEQYKVIVYPQINHRQLFDLSRDPDETRDLSTDVEYRPVLERMLTRLNLAQQSFGDTQPLQVSDPGPRDIDLSGQAREPDRWQPDWIVDKCFR